LLPYSDQVVESLTDADYKKGSTRPPRARLGGRSRHLLDRKSS